MGAPIWRRACADQLLTRESGNVQNSFADKGELIVASVGFAIKFGGRALVAQYFAELCRHRQVYEDGLMLGRAFSPIVHGLIIDVVADEAAGVV